MLSASKLLIAPEQSVATVRWLNTGNIGKWASAGPSSWTHDIPRDANCIVVAINHHNTSVAIGPITGYVGSSAYPLKLVSITPNYLPGGYGGYISLFYCLNPPKGLVTITITANPSAYTCAVSMAYSGVGSVAPVKAVVGTATTSAQASISAPAGQMVVAAISDYASVPGPTNFTQTLRASIPFQSSMNLNMVVGDAMSSGTAPLNFGVNFSSSQNWGVIAARLVPASVTPPSTTRAYMEFWGTGGITAAWTENHFWVPTTSDSIVAEGEWLQNPYDQPVFISTSIDFSGTAGTGAKGDYDPVTSVGIFERGDTAVNGLNYVSIQGPGAGTVTATYSGFIEANRWFTGKIAEGNVGGYGSFYHGTLSIVPLGTSAGW